MSRNSVNIYLPSNSVWIMQKHKYIQETVRMTTVGVYLGVTYDNSTEIILDQDSVLTILSAESS